VLTHEVNRGKGAALKTAFKWYMENRDGLGVVTADGDGQHKPEDARNLAVAMEKSEKIILGVRDFSLPDVPERSKKGNRITSGVFKIFVGMEISDTQTGLRGIPAKYLPKLCTVYGDRYEYETNMLLYMKRWDFPFEEVKIETVYINENETSHFRPVRDSMRIYSLIIKFLVTGVFVKFLGSSLLSFIVDYGLFEIFQLLFRALGLVSLAVGAAYAVARVFSSLLNYFLNRKIFESKGSVKKTMIRYYALALGILVVGSVVTAVLTNVVAAIPTVTELLAGMDNGEMETVISTAIKLPVDLILFIVSYTVQKKYVFKKEQNS
jgi:glycosyltransferase involved in cell wall biosynthesis